MSEKPLYFLGYDIGGTKIAVCLADSTGNVLESGRIPSGGTTEYEEVFPQAVELGKELVKKAGMTMDEIDGCGVCAPGPLDVPNGLLLKSPNMTWDKIPIKSDLEKALGIPVFFDNDANGGVLAEWFFGAAKGYKDVIYLTMSTGVGGGIIANGHLIQGTTGVAGELGHLVLDINGPMCGCGQRGCFEAYCGGRTVGNRLRKILEDQPNHALMKLDDVQGDPEKLSFQAIREGAVQGIPLAIEMWDEICMRLAQGIGQTLMAFNSEVVVLGTAAYYAGDLMLNPVKRHLPRFCWKDMWENCDITVSGLGLKIGELAGISIALYGLYEKGEWNPAE